MNEHLTRAAYDEQSEAVNVELKPFWKKEAMKLAEKIIAESKRLNLETRDYAIMFIAVRPFGNQRQVGLAHLHYWGCDADPRVQRYYSECLDSASEAFVERYSQGIEQDHD